MRRGLLLAAAATLAVIGCSSAGGGETADTTAQASAVPEALQFDAPLVGGGRFDARQQGGRPLALWFWAPY